MDITFEPVPDEETPRPRRGGRWSGARLPHSVPFFDCRWHDDRPEPRNPNTGLILWGTERAEFALGDNLAGFSGRYVRPFGILTPYDTREPRNAARVAEDVGRLRGMLERQWRAYRLARRHLAGRSEGGGVVFRPVAIALTNFGASVLAVSEDSLTYPLTTRRRAARKRPS